MVLTPQEVQRYRQRYGLDKSTNTNHEARMQRLNNIANEQRVEKGQVDESPQNVRDEIQKNTLKQTRIGQIAEGAGKGIVSSVRNIGDLLSKAGEYIPESIKTAAQTFMPAKSATAELFTTASSAINQLEDQYGERGDLSTPTTPLEKVGFTGEQIAEYLIPGGTSTKMAKSLGKYGKAAQLAGRVAGEVAEGVTITGIQTAGDIQEMKRDAYFSAALPILGATARGVKGLAGVSKGKGVLATTGEILTGIEADKLNKWYDLAKNSPERISAAKQIITTNPTNPYAELARGVGEALNSYKRMAKESFDEAVNQVKLSNPSKVFNLQNNVPELNKTLSKFNLKIDSKGGLSATTRTSPFTKQELTQVSDIARKMQTPNMTVDELLDFDASIKSFMDDAVRKDNKKLIALGGELLSDSSRFIDNALPEVNAANQMYRNYYTAMDKGGRKFIDQSGEIKTSAEGYLKNVFNKNKGEQLDQLKQMEETLGIKVLDNVEDIKLANEMMATVPLTVRNRTIDVIRGIVSNKAFGGGAALGSFVNPALAVPAVLLNLLSSPKVFTGLIEAIAGKSKNTPVRDVIKNLSQEELNILNNLLQGIFAQSFNSNEERLPVEDKKFSK